MYNRSRGRVRFQCSWRRRRRLCPPDVSADGKVPLGPAEPRILLWVKGLYDKPVLTSHLLSSVPFLRLRKMLTGTFFQPVPHEHRLPAMSHIRTVYLSILSLYIIFLIAPGVRMTNDLTFIYLRNQTSCGILDTDPAFAP